MRLWYKKPWPKLFLFVLAFFTVLIPLQPQWLPITLGIMVMGLFWLLHGRFKQKLKALSKNMGAGWLFLYYLVVFAGLFYTTNGLKAEEELLLKIPFLVWPIMLSSNLGITTAHLKKLVLFFVYATAFAVLLAFGHALMNYFAFSHSLVFYFSNFSFYRFIPPHYLGLYVNFAYGLLLIGWLKYPTWVPARRYTLSILAMLALSLVFISVRMQFLVFAVVNMGAAFIYLQERGFRLKAVVGVVGLLLVFGGLAFSFKGSRSRLIDAYHELKSINTPVNNKQTNPRFYLWPAAVEVIGEHFWLGTGAGAEKAALNKKLKRHEALFWDGTQAYRLHEKGYNYHNSFLQHFAAQGLFGFLAFTALFVVPLFRLSTNPLAPWALLFLILSALSFLTESMLQRQAGVLFFSFFWCLFFVVPQRASQ